MPYHPPLADGSALIAMCQILVPAAALLEKIPLAMDQQRHDYYFDWIWNITWQGTILTKRRNLTTPQKLRNLRTWLPRITKGGWHFSYMGGVDRIINKMTSIVDANEIVVKSEKNFTAREYVKECMRTGKHLYGDPRIDFYPYDISKINLPYLNEFVKKYPYFLREYEFGKNDL